MQIRTDRVTFTYDKKNPNLSFALKGVDLQINEGEFVTLVGHTGSGKSTLVQTFNALLLPTSGVTYVDEFIVCGNKKELKLLLESLPKDKRKTALKHSNLRRKVGLVFQFPEYQLFNDTVLKDVMYGPKNFGLKDEEAKEKAIQSLEEVGIPSEYFEKSPFELSGGEKRRVAIAGILASEPDILVLDEPTAGLDPKGKKEILALIKKQHEKGKTIIIVTHDMDIALEYASRVIVLAEGKIIDDTTPKELFKKDNLDSYSLEIPSLYKFKNLLKNGGFAANLNEIDTFEGIIDAVCEAKK